LQNHFAPSLTDPERLGFWSKNKLKTKLKEETEAIKHAYYIVREITDTEQQKFECWGAHQDLTKWILGWHWLENEQVIIGKIDRQREEYNAFNHPFLSEFFESQ
jgi:hypothetical protein